MRYCPRHFLEFPIATEKAVYFAYNNDLEDTVLLYLDNSLKQAKLMGSYYFDSNTFKYTTEGQAIRKAVARVEEFNEASKSHYRLELDLYHTGLLPWNLKDEYNLRIFLFVEVINEIDISQCNSKYKEELKEAKKIVEEYDTNNVFFLVDSMYERIPRIAAIFQETIADHFHSEEIAKAEFTRKLMWKTSK